MNLLFRLVPLISMIGLLSLLACGTAQESTQAPSADGGVPIAQPTNAPDAPFLSNDDKYGGTLKVQVHLDPTGVDLHTPRGASSREFWIAQPALNYLVLRNWVDP